MTDRFTESVVEEAALGWLHELGYSVLHRPEIASVRLNPGLPPEAIEDAFRKLTRADAPSLIERNRALHRMLVDGVTVEFRRPVGSIAGATGSGHRLRRPGRDDWLAVNQFTVAEGQHTCRPDVVVITQWPCRHRIAGKDDERAVALDVRT